MKIIAGVIIGGIIVIGALVLINTPADQELPTVTSDDQDVSATTTEPVAQTPAQSEAEMSLEAESEKEVVVPTPAPAETVSKVREFTIDAFSYQFSQSEIVVNEGDTVTINLTNSGGYHDWALDEFDARTVPISTGQTASVTFVATKKGSFEYYCSVGLHRSYGMIGTLVVQ